MGSHCRQNDRYLEGYLRTRGITDLTLVGLATDFCVNFSAVDAAKLGFRVTVRDNHMFDGSVVDLL